MKTGILTLFAAILFSAYTYGQTTKTKAEVLYFKANLSCCKAKACNSLEADVQKVVESKFSGKNVSFKEVKLSDATNTTLVKQYNAKSQTVVIVVTKNGKQTNTDISKIVQDHAENNDFAKFEKELIASIDTAIK